MAIDSREKRTSAAGVGRPWMRATHTDAAKGAAWRQSVGLSYASGLLAVTVRPQGFLINVGRVGQK